MILAFAAAACARAPMVREFDSDAARRTLVTALDAWMKGDPASLSRHVPPIRLVDDDLAAGARLERYEVVSPNEKIRFGDSIEVVLHLRTRQGKQIERRAAYQVALTPHLAVFRVDE